MIKFKPNEPLNKKPIVIRLTVSQENRLRALAKQFNTTCSNLIRQMIEHCFDELDIDMDTQHDTT